MSSYGTMVDEVDFSFGVGGENQWSRAQQSTIKCIPLDGDGGKGGCLDLVGIYIKFGRKLEVKTVFI